MDSIIKAIHYKAKHVINLKVDPTILHARGSKSPKTMTLVCALEN